jgi:hypothetical protein
MNQLKDDDKRGDQIIAAIAATDHPIFFLN